MCFTRTSGTPSFRSAPHELRSVLSVSAVEVAQVRCCRTIVDHPDSCNADTLRAQRLHEALGARALRGTAHVDKQRDR